MCIDINTCLYAPSAYAAKSQIHSAYEFRGKKHYDVHYIFTWMIIPTLTHININWGEWKKSERKNINRRKKNCWLKANRWIKIVNLWWGNGIHDFDLMYNLHSSIIHNHRKWQKQHTYNSLIPYNCVFGFAIFIIVFPVAYLFQ